MTSQTLRGRPVSATGTGPPAPVGRIVSLDVARGVVICMNLVVVSVLAPRPAQLHHAHWIGLTVFDLVFPLFVTLSGCGLAFAYRNRVGWGATLRRSLILLACGLAYNVVVSGWSLDPGTLRFTGPLQVYTVLVLVIGLLHLRVRTVRGWVLVTLGVAAVQAFVFAAWQAGCPGGELLPTCNPSRLVDPAVLGRSHIYHQGLLGHDPEGLVSIVGALVTACVGTTAGHLALASRGTRRGPVRLLVWAGVSFAAALVALQFIPEMKRQWTTPFALGVAALAVVLFAVGLVVMDLPAPRLWERIRPKVAWPLLALGRNALLVYFGSHLMLDVMLRRGGETPWSLDVARAVDVVGHPRVSFVIFMFVLWALVAAFLHHRRIYLRP